MFIRIRLAFLTFSFFLRLKQNIFFAFFYYYSFFKYFVLSIRYYRFASEKKRDEISKTKTSFSNTLKCNLGNT